MRAFTALGSIKRGGEIDSASGKGWNTSRTSGN